MDNGCYFGKIPPDLQIPPLNSFCLLPLPLDHGWPLSHPIPQIITHDVVCVNDVVGVSDDVSSRLSMHRRLCEIVHVSMISYRSEDAITSLERESAKLIEVHVKRHQRNVHRFLYNDKRQRPNHPDSTYSIGR